MNIWTGKRIYRDMLIQSLSTTTNAESENALIVDIVCRQVLIARTQTTASRSENQKFPERTGGQINRGTVQVYPVNLGDFH